MLDSVFRLEALERRLERAFPTPPPPSGNTTNLLSYPDPVDFFREVLQTEPWDRQAEVLRAVRDHPRVAVRSGHKVGKSTSAAGLALWWYATRPRGIVVLTSSSDDQIRQILWVELKRLYQRATRPIGGVLHESHRTGLVAPDGRRIIGIATKHTENMGGFSGAELLFIADEASGIDQGIFDAIEGNRAGGAYEVMFGNPTQTSGPFYDAFHGSRDFWRTVQISSEEAAAYQERHRIIPGLATREWVEEKRLEWAGKPNWDIRVVGNFPGQATNAIIGLTLVEAASKRYAELSAGRVPDALDIGVDVARFGDDESVVTGLRGKLALPSLVLHSMDGPDVAGKVLEYARLHRRTGERPRVKVDVIGYGASAFDVLVRCSEEVEAIAVNVSESATAKAAPGDPGYAKLRDQLWFGVSDWLKDGGALPPDSKLEAELVAPMYRFDTRGNYVVESKEELKKRLKRSPDRADALALAIYNPPNTVPTFSSPDRMVGRRI